MAGSRSVLHELTFNTNANPERAPIDGTPSCEKNYYR